MSGWSLKLNLMFTKLLMHSVNFHLLLCWHTKRSDFSPHVSHPNLTICGVPVDSPQTANVPTAQIIMDALTVCVGVCLRVCLCSAQPLTELNRNSCSIYYFLTVSLLFPLVSAHLWSTFKELMDLRLIAPFLWLRMLSDRFQNLPCILKSQLGVRLLTP